MSLPPTAQAGERYCQIPIQTLVQRAHRSSGTGQEGPPMSLNPLTGRGAVVAGGSRGIGRAVAELLCDLGAGVVVNGRDPVAVRETVAAISASGGRAASVVGAADDERIARRLIEECTSVFGRHDVLINC